MVENKVQCDNSTIDPLNGGYSSNLNEKDYLKKNKKLFISPNKVRAGSEEQRIKEKRPVQSNSNKEKDIQLLNKGSNKLVLRANIIDSKPYKSNKDLIEISSINNNNNNNMGITPLSQQNSKIEPKNINSKFIVNKKKAIS